MLLKEAKDAAAGTRRAEAATRKAEEAKLSAEAEAASAREHAEAAAAARVEREDEAERLRRELKFAQDALRVQGAARPSCSFSLCQDYDNVLQFPKLLHQACISSKRPTELSCGAAWRCT